MRPITVPGAENVILALQDEIRRSDESRYDHRLQGLLLVAQELTAPAVGRGWMTPREWCSTGATASTRRAFPTSPRVIVPSSPPSHRGPNAGRGSDLAPPTRRGRHLGNPMGREGSPPISGRSSSSISGSVSASACSVSSGYGFGNHAPNSTPPTPWSSGSTKTPGAEPRSFCRPLGQGRGPLPPARFSVPHVSPARGGGPGSLPRLDPQVCGLLGSGSPT